MKPKEKKKRVCSLCYLIAKLLEDFRKQDLKLQSPHRIENQRLDFIQLGTLKILGLCFFQKPSHLRLLFIIILLLLKPLNLKWFTFTFP